MIKKVSNPFGFGLYATRIIARGTKLFEHDDWITDEQIGWDLLAIDEVAKLPERERHLFEQYMYSKDFDHLIGTFDWNNATHVSNFINHSCNPNLIYNEDDNIVARRDIAPDEELTLDYGVVVVNIDQPFMCGCAQPNCRKSLLKDDWKKLVLEYKYNVPAFMRDEVRKILSNVS